MSQEQVMGLIRTLLATFGGLLVNKGITDTETMTVIVGGLTALGTVVWSLWMKRETSILKQAEKIVSQDRK